MIPVHSIMEVNESFGSLGVSYLSFAFGDGVKPVRMTCIPIRNLSGILINNFFVRSEAI